MKSCDICGTLNLKENNYCTHCGNKLITENICPFCGEENLEYAVNCSNCGEQINPITIDDFDVLFSQFNEDLLSNAKISDVEYNKLLSDIFLRAKFISLHAESIKSKILNFASAFARCEPKARGFERGFIFLGNNIFYDDRLDDSVQIATIIHELGHYFLFTIIESLLCCIFKINSSSTLQSFIWYFLTLPEFKIMNEYCAHTIEGRFIPYGYQNYGSFNILVENTTLDNESIETMMMLGNSFANEIIVYLEKYIDEGFRQEIKLQYKMDLKTPNYESIFIETDDCFQLNVKNKIIIDILYDVFKEASSSEIRKELMIIREGIEST